jgi:hypothetical protein
MIPVGQCNGKERHAAAVMDDQKTTPEYSHGISMNPRHARKKCPPSDGGDALP